MAAGKPHHNIAFDAAAWSLKAENDYAACGFKDGKRVCAQMRHTDECRRLIVLKAAQKVHSHAGWTRQYLNGLEAGMKDAGAAGTTARRLRYEVCVIIRAWGISIPAPAGNIKTASSNGCEVAKEWLGHKTLQAQTSWPALVNTARRMIAAANDRKRLHQGIQQHRLGRGNHTPRKFNDRKFEKLREQLIDRTSKQQALDLLDAAIIAVANGYGDIAASEIEALRAAEQRIYDKTGADNADAALPPKVLDERSGLIPRLN